MVTAFLRNLFGKRKSARDDVKTAPLSEEQVQTVAEMGVHLEPAQLLVGCGQSVGRQREHNEDTLFTLNVVQAGNKGNVTFGIFIMADGMGGHQHGEIASGVATRVMASELVRKIFTPLFGATSEPPAEPVQEIMQTGIREAQQAVMHYAPGGGTTLTAALVMGDQVTLAHVGDSRAYFIYPDGRMEVVTRDHSLVHRLQELGQLSEKEAATHPQRNVLYRAIGQGEPFEADVNTYRMPHPGYLMLCTDGLWGVVSEDEIYRIVTESADPTQACQNLVEAANLAGGPDNISIVLIYSPN
jgi:serine/threonine protein phosphatase PrpC